MYIVAGSGEIVAALVGLEACGCVPDGGPQVRDGAGRREFACRASSASAPWCPGPTPSALSRSGCCTSSQGFGGSGRCRCRSSSGPSRRAACGTAGTSVIPSIAGSAARWSPPRGFIPNEGSSDPSAPWVNRPERGQNFSRLVSQAQPSHEGHLAYPAASRCDRPTETRTAYGGPGKGATEVGWGRCALRRDHARGLLQIPLLWGFPPPRRAS